jgi:hypothetical protein
MKYWNLEFKILKFIKNDNIQRNHKHRRKYSPKLVKMDATQTY